MKRTPLGEVARRLRRAQLGEPAVRLLAAISAVLTAYLLVCAMRFINEVPGAADWRDALYLLSSLMMLAAPLLLGIRPLTALVLSAASILISKFALMFDEAPADALWMPIVAGLLAFCVVKVRVGGAGRWGAIAFAIGFASALYWSLPIAILMDDWLVDDSPTVMVPLFLGLPWLIGRLDASRTLAGSIWLSDTRTILFRITGFMTAALSAIGFAGWADRSLNALLVSGPLESLASVGGWVAGATMLIGLGWLVWRLPIRLSRAQSRGSAHPAAIAESMWFMIALTLLTSIVEMANGSFGQVSWATVLVAAAYAGTRIILSRPLPIGRIGLWIVPLEQGGRALRATLRKIATSWTCGPVTVLAQPALAAAIGDAHQRVCVDTRTMTRLFPLREAHLDDWDDCLPPIHVWNTLPIRELYAAAELWPQILCTRVTGTSRVVALDYKGSGALIGAASNATRLKPKLDDDSLNEIAEGGLCTSRVLRNSLARVRKLLTLQKRNVLILHVDEHRSAAWALHRQLSGATDAQGAMILPFVIPYEARTLPLGFGPNLLALAYKEWAQSFNPSKRVIARLLGKIVVSDPDATYDLIVLEPTTGRRPEVSRVGSMLLHKNDLAAFENVISLRDSFLLEEGDALAAGKYKGYLQWTYVPELTARAADAAQKILAREWLSKPMAPAKPEKIVVGESAPTAGSAPTIVSTASRTQSMVELFHDQQVVFAAFAPLLPEIEPTLVTTSRDCSARVWYAQSGASTGTPVMHLDSVRHVAFDSISGMFATAGKDGLIKICHERGAEVTSLYADGPLTHVAFDPTGNRLVSCGALEARVWNWREKREIAQLRHEAAVGRAEFSPDGRRVLTCSYDHTARLWDSETGAPVGSEMRHVRAVHYATMSRDGRLIATASEDRSARIWHADSCMPVGAILRHSGAIVRIVFNPQKEMVATSGVDGSARLWDLAGTPIGAPFEHPASVNCVAFDSLGNRLATACEDGFVREWDVTSGKKLAEHQLQGRVYYVSYAPSGLNFVAVDASHSAKLFVSPRQDM